MGKRSKISKTDLRRAIEADGGIISKMAARFGVTRQTIYNRLDETGLRPLVAQARESIFDMAVDNAIAWLDAGDPVMTRFVLTHYPGGERWSSKQELNVTAVNLSPDTVKLLRDLGVEADEVSAQFEMMIQQIHAEMKADE